MACYPNGIRLFLDRLLERIGIKSTESSSEKQPLTISAPFNFKHESISLPGVSDEEIAIMKERAAISIGTPRKAPSPPMPNYPSPSTFSTPRKAPAPPKLSSVPALEITPSTPISPASVRV
ncbi:hypothetical protein GGR52DRAFT_380058 [Hypoxylon sp. FL1284]|nr:hypothetical protein GGR52DRAFT_380058 [Hypoxylon sp. FL1284]